MMSTLPSISNNHDLDATSYGSEEDDNVSLSEDSVYLRMTEHGTSRVLEEVFRRHQAAASEVNGMTLNKQFFTGHSQVTNNEIYFQRDLTTPAIQGGINVTAKLASAAVDIRSRQTICSKLDVSLSEAPPDDDTERNEKAKMKINNAIKLLI